MATMNMLQAINNALDIAMACDSEGEGIRERLVALVEQTLARGEAAAAGTAEEKLS